jgi:hypothetical protein
MIDVVLRCDVQYEYVQTHLRILPKDHPLHRHYVFVSFRYVCSLLLFLIHAIYVYVGFSKSVTDQDCLLPLAYIFDQSQSMASFLRHPHPQPCTFQIA